MDNTNKSNLSETKEDDVVNFNDLFATISGMLRLIKKRFLAVVLTVLLTAGISLGFSVARYNPVYKSAVTFSITPLLLRDATSGLSAYKFNYVVSLADQINLTFPHIINSNALMESISYDLGKPINGRITSDSVYGSNIFKVYVVSPSPEEANDIMNSFINCYPKIAEHIIGDAKIKVIHKSNAPLVPSNQPNHVVHTLLGGFIGLFICCFIFFVVAKHTQTINDKDDVLTKLNSHYICQIPNVAKKRSNKNEALLKASSKTPGFLEAVRVMKKRVFSLLREKENIIAVTSTFDGDGKTTIAYNLAMSCATGGKKTLLVGMDLLGKSLQKQLLQDPDNCIGISEIVKSGASIESAVCNICENFDVLFAGSVDCKLSNPEFKRVFEEIKGMYDYIVVDTPSCAVVTDTASVADLCDVVVYTVKSNSTSVQSIKKALQCILYSKARLIGFVLNDKDQPAGDYSKKGYYSHYKRYGYRYNYGYGYGVDKVKPKK